MTFPSVLVLSLRNQDIKRALIFQSGLVGILEIDRRTDVSSICKQAGAMVGDI